MPKATKRKSFGHEQSAKPLSKRQLAVVDSQVEHVDVGSQILASGNEILEDITDAAEAKPVITMKKKEKQMLKHDEFVKRLESSRAQHSKSHERRMKRKAKEQVAGGLAEIHDAIAAMEAADGTADVGESNDPTESTADAKTPRNNSGQIGEGKSATLSKAQRKRALQTERLRMPLIRSNPQFSANPFETIRTHAQNTLLKHQVPQVPESA